MEGLGVRAGAGTLEDSTTQTERPPSACDSTTQSVGMPEVSRSVGIGYTYCFWCMLLPSIHPFLPSHPLSLTHPLPLCRCACQSFWRRSPRICLRLMMPQPAVLYHPPRRSPAKSTIWGRSSSLAPRTAWRSSMNLGDLTALRYVLGLLHCRNINTENGIYLFLAVVQFIGFFGVMYLISLAFY